MFRSTLTGTAILAIAFALASPALAEGKGKVYGDGVKLEEATPIATLLASPSAWVGKQVRVDGVATDVCEMMGCWIELNDKDSGKGIRFKVEDGVIVFPVTAKGHKASAEGTFEEVSASAEEHKEHAKEHAAEHKKHAKAHAKEHAGHAKQAKGPSYRIRATGAVIY